MVPVPRSPSPGRRVLRRPGIPGARPVGMDSGPRVGAACLRCALLRDTYAGGRRDPRAVAPGPHPSGARPAVRRGLRRFYSGVCRDRALVPAEGRALDGQGERPPSRGRTHDVVPFLALRGLVRHLPSLPGGPALVRAALRIWARDAGRRARPGRGDPDRPPPRVPPVLVRLLPGPGRLRGYPVAPCRDSRPGVPVRLPRGVAAPGYRPV